MSDSRDALIERIEAENDVLRERIASLESLLMQTSDETIPVEVAVALTASERVVLGVLMQRERVRKEQIMAALYRDLGKDEAEPKIVDVFVCKLRRKLKPFGIDIKTIWGSGYYIDAETKRKVMGEQSASVAA